jgi:hypothetical protein
MLGNQPFARGGVRISQGSPAVLKFPFKVPISAIGEDSVQLKKPVH